MKISLTMNDSDLTVGQLTELQNRSFDLGGDFELSRAPDGFIIKWDFEPTDPVKFIDMLDELTVSASQDIMDVCEIVDPDEIAFNPSVELWSIGDNLHTPDNYS